MSGLCCQVEHGGELAVQAAVQKWLNGRLDLQKPGLLAKRGSLTVLDIRQACDPAGHRRRVEAWAENVWAAYAEQQAIARGYIQAARGIFPSHLPGKPRNPRG